MDGAVQDRNKSWTRTADGTVTVTVTVNEMKTSQEHVGNKKEFLRPVIVAKSAAGGRDNDGKEP